MAEEVELVGGFAAAEDVLAGVEAHIGRAADEQLQIVGLEGFEERMLGEDSLKGLHGLPPLRLGRWRGWRGLPR